SERDGVPYRLVAPEESWRIAEAKPGMTGRDIAEGATGRTNSPMDERRRQFELQRQRMMESGVEIIGAPGGAMAMESERGSGGADRRDTDKPLAALAPIKAPDDEAEAKNVIVLTWDVVIEPAGGEDKDGGDL
ncbi:MAG: hypothetical protein KDA28_02020, partial [Phycisphaerales bacterium]|nr:hypothetical protein [Phycisphaerales bacterium]